MAPAKPFGNTCRADGAAVGEAGCRTEGVENKSDVFARDSRLPCVDYAAIACVQQLDRSGRICGIRGITSSPCYAVFALHTKVRQRNETGNRQPRFTSTAT
jgi:hypothetical protein